MGGWAGGGGSGGQRAVGASASVAVPLVKSSGCARPAGRHIHLAPRVITGHLLLGRRRVGVDPSCSLDKEPAALELVLQVNSNHALHQVAGPVNLLAQNDGAAFLADVQAT